MTAIKNGDWRAADVILTRVYGKPKTVEHQQSHIDRIAAMSDEERAALRDRIDKRWAQARRMGLVD
jgi:hypothetical protein